VQVLCFTRYVRAHGKECREKVKRAEDKVEQAKRELGQRAKEDRLLFSGALGVSVLAILGLLPMAELNSTLSFSLHFFAISIPLCAMGVVLTNWLLSGEDQMRYYGLYIAFGYGGLFVTFCGLVGLFLHLGNVLGTFFYGWGTAWLFFFSVLFAFAVGGLVRGGRRSGQIAAFVIILFVISILVAGLVSFL
jgi:hypothetical protein